MVAALTFTFDTRQLDPFRNRRVVKAIARAAAKAGSTAIRKMRTEAGRTVRGRKKLKARVVKDGLPLVFPVGAKDLNSLVWRMKVSGQVVPVIEYSARQVRAGVSVQINKTGGRKVIPSAFVATMKSGHRGVFRRKTKGGPRLPIEELFSTRLVDVFGDADVIPALHKVAQGEFASRFVALLPLELDRAKAHAG